nr:FHA domain-containing protein [Methylomonas sp. SURF-2]
MSRKKITRRMNIRENLTAGSGGDLVLDGPDVGRTHLSIAFDDNGFQIAPIGNAPVSINGKPIHQASTVIDGDWLALGTTLFQIRLPEQSATTRPTSPHRTEPVAAYPSKSSILTMGRSPQCDFPLPSPLVSREHARIVSSSDNIFIEDLGSTNGTFVNGKRLERRVALHKGDRVCIGSFAFVFTGDELKPSDLSGRVRVVVKGLYKEVIDHASRQRKRLLDDINLVIEPGEFVVLFGTSGSGKSTLLDAMNGRRPATGGHVLYNDTDLYSSFDSFRASIGYVPQQDIVHRKIVTDRALTYTAKLRLPKDTDATEIHNHIRRVLEKVKLTDKARAPIDTPAPLSGGQLKRVSLAVELVANPNILFLDEATSGLDAGTDKHMMKLFAELANDAKTVVCVTHSLENIDVCDLVVLLHKGRLVYFGPPREACAYFGLERLSGVYDLLEDESVSPSEWAERYRASDLYAQYVAGRMRKSADFPDGAGQTTPKKSWFGCDFRQASTLTLRYVDLVLADRKNLMILLLQAPLIAVLLGLVCSLEGDEVVRARLEGTIAFLLILSAIWFGTLNSAREVVKELPIYLRERSVNLGIAPYLLSKLLPLAILCLLQCLMLLGIVHGMLSLSFSLPGSLAALFLAAFSATCMGLAVSAFVDSNDKAIAIAPILLVPQVVLSNAVVPLGKVSLWVAKSSMISFWALDAMKNTLPEKTLALKDLAGNTAVALSENLQHDLSMVGLLGLAFIAVAVTGLKRKDRPA